MEGNSLGNNTSPPSQISVNKIEGFFFGDLHFIQAYSMFPLTKHGKMAIHDCSDYR